MLIKNDCLYNDTQLISTWALWMRSTEIQILYKFLQVGHELPHRTNRSMGGRIDQILHTWRYDLHILHFGINKKIC
jgi:hypothetical protein